MGPPTPASQPTPLLRSAIISATLLAACADEAPATDTVADAVLTIDGTIASSVRLAGTQTVNITCTVLGFSPPCAWEVPFTAEFRF